MTSRAILTLMVTTLAGVLVSLLGFNAWVMWSRTESIPEIRTQQAVMQRDVSALQSEVNKQGDDIRIVKSGVEEVRRTLKEDWEAVAGSGGTR